MGAVGNRHLRHPPVLAGVTLDRARAIGVLVHRRDQGPEVMLDVADRLALDGVGYVLPVADGRSWYPGRYFDPPADNEPHVGWSLAAVARAVAIAGDGAPLAPPPPRRGRAAGPPAPAPPAPLPMLFAGSRYDEWVPLKRVQSSAQAF